MSETPVEYSSADGWQLLPSTAPREAQRHDA